ncbi:MAG: helix-turn-helix domain-containing protein [Nanoarchaeota archaeon]
MEIEQILKEIGLTGSEVKVYLALINLGLSSKSDIIRESKIASSKIYNVLDKLMDKGMVSMITKNNVKYYAAAPVSRIKDYFEIKKIKIEQEEKIINQILPNLENLQKEHKEKTSAEIFIGWKGMETVYSDVLGTIKKGEYAYILGASTGVNEEKTKRFFIKYAIKAKLKGIKVKTIFNENARQYVKEMEKEGKIKFNKKFLFKNTPVEIAIVKNLTAIVMLKEEPLIILIHDKETSESFITYFNELWKIAKN